MKYELKLADSVRDVIDGLDGIINALQNDPITYNLSFYYNGGKIGSEISSMSTLTYNAMWPTAPNITTPKTHKIRFVTAITGTTAARTEGFSCQFNGYWSTIDGTGDQYYTNSFSPTQQKFIGNSDLSAYANWINPRAPSSGNFTYTPKKEGFDFGGWYEDRSSITRIYNYSSLNDDKILYAKWISQITSKTVTISGISISDTRVNTSSSSQTYKYTLTIPSAQLSSVPDNLHLKQIYFEMYVRTENSKPTRMTVSFSGGGESPYLAVNTAGDAKTKITSIDGEFTSYTKNKNIVLNIEFHLSPGNDTHRGNFRVTVNKVLFGL